MIDKIKFKNYKIFKKEQTLELKQDKQLTLYLLWSCKYQIEELEK